MSKPSLILVSGRFASPDASLTRAAAFAHALAEMGCEVRWIVPGSPGAASPALPERSKVTVLPVASDAPGFSAVQGRLLDPASELVLSEAIRRQLPDLVHVLDYGGCTSVNLSWVTTRLGVRCVVSVASHLTVCHRGDLRYRGAEACDQFGDPDRCSACVLAAATGGLSLWGAAVSRAFRTLRLPLSPYPSPMNFVNRQELLVGGLRCAKRVFLAEESDRSRLRTLGLRDEVFEVQPPISGGEDSAERYLQLYAEAIRSD